MRQMIILLVLLLASSAQAKTIVGEVMDGGNPVSGAKVEIIRLDNDTYYTSGGKDAPGNFFGGEILTSPTNSGKPYVTITASTPPEDTGKIMNLLQTAATGIFISESDITPATKNLIVRAWSADGSKYGYSGSFPWGDAQQGNLTQNVGNISLTYNAEVPGTPTVILSHNGYDLDLNPLVTCQISVNNSELTTPKYQYHLDDVTPNQGSTGTKYDTDASSPLLSGLVLGHTYQLCATAHNAFGSSKEEGKSAEKYIKDSSGTVAPVSFTLNFNTGADNSQLNLNFFALPFAPDAGGKWYAPDNAKYKEISTAYDLVKAINEANGNVNLVSTFGKWDSTPSVQKDAGVLILDNNPDNTAKEPGQTKDVKTRLQELPLQQGEGYQVYVTQPGSLTIKNKL